MARLIDEPVRLGEELLLCLLVRRGSNAFFELQARLDVGATELQPTIDRCPGLALG